MKKILVLILMLFLVVCGSCGEDSNEKTEITYSYNDFSPSEKNTITNVMGELIPFLPNNEYYLEYNDGNNSLIYKVVIDSDVYLETYKNNLVSQGYTNTSWDINNGWLYEKNDLNVMVNLSKSADAKKMIIVNAYKDFTDINTPSLDGDTPSQSGGNTNPEFTDLVYEIASQMPTGLTYITNNSQYPDPDFGSQGGLKLRFEGQGMQTTEFTVVNNIFVTLTIGALNANSKTAQASTDLFTIYGLNASGSVVATKTLTSVIVGDNTVELSGPNITSVKVIMTGYPYNGSAYCNPLVTSLAITKTGTVTPPQGGGNTDPVTPPPAGGGDTPYTYTSFSSSDKVLLEEYLGTSNIPFLPTNEYYLDENEDYNMLNYYTFGNTESEYKSYMNSLKSAGYTLDETYEDDYGDTCYVYVKGNVYIDLCAYDSEDNGYCVDIYLYYYEESSGGDTDPVTPPTDSYLTIDEFLDLADTENYYYLTGTVTNIVNTQYGNFTLVDSTGSVYVYGLLPYEGATKGQFASMGISAGDEITIAGVYHVFNGSIEVSGAYLVSTEQGGNNGGSTGSYIYNSFSSSDEALLIEWIGTTDIPFIPTNEYYLEESIYDDLNYYTLGNTKAEYNAFINSLKSLGYTLANSYEDDYGDTWSIYEKDGVYVESCWYVYENDTNIIDIYLYTDSYSGGNDGGDTINGELITNEGAGLPTDVDGIYDVDFTQGIVANVSEQGVYEYGCPTTGDVNVLVIPVEFSDALASSKGYKTSVIDTVFNGLTGVDYVSVAEYYNMSSYNQLSLNFVVLENWFKPQYSSEYYYEQVDSDGYECGDQMVIDEALAYLEDLMDLSIFDSNSDSVIDAIVMVNTLEIGEEDFYWAYRYWNYYVDSDGNYYEYDGVTANDYIWASYQFILETYDNDGDTIYVDGVVNPYTYIHEFGHVLGADDYYDTAYVSHPLDGADMMDSGLGDHNPYTKFNYGWITSSRLIVASDTITVTLEDFSKNGDTIIIANNWDAELGVYQEYYVLMYYTHNGLNSTMNGVDYGFFLNEGIVMYHVNASLQMYEYYGETYYDVFYNNTHESDYYGTSENLIEFVKSPSDTFVYTLGMTSSSNTVDDLGNKISYTFTVDSLTSDSATITFTKNN